MRSHMAGSLKSGLKNFRQEMPPEMLRLDDAIFVF